MSFRRFVLEPASEIAGDMRHPVCWNCREPGNEESYERMTIRDLLDRINQTSSELLWLTQQKERAVKFVDVLKVDHPSWKFHIVDPDNWIPFEDQPPIDPKLVIVEDSKWTSVFGPVLNLWDCPQEAVSYTHLTLPTICSV